jgi:hypothetical protein
VDKVIVLQTVPRFLCVTRDLWDGKLGTLNKGATAGSPPSAHRRGWRSPNQVVVRKDAERSFEGTISLAEFSLLCFIAGQATTA